MPPRATKWEAQLNMRCYFLRGGHIVAAEELAGVSDKEVIEKAHVLFSERENPVGAFEVWDQTRVIIPHPPILLGLGARVETEVIAFGEVYGTS